MRSPSGAVATGASSGIGAATARRPGTLQMTKTLMLALIESGRGHVVNITSIAGLLVHEEGAGCAVAKQGRHAVPETLRPVRW